MDKGGELAVIYANDPEKCETAESALKMHHIGKMRPEPAAPDYGCEE